ncbi:MAG: hypothetical protein LBQ50_11805 [Planctomycetaceae bacterium]|nr:hypothetical protein [Planctomycetaceae bacterium]
MDLFYQNALGQNIIASGNARRNNFQTRFGATPQSSISLRRCREWILMNRYVGRCPTL